MGNSGRLDSDGDRDGVRGVRDGVRGDSDDVRGGYLWHVEKGDTTW